MNIKQGALVLAALDPVIGHEIAKTRPVVVVSNDINNRYSGTVTILPVSSKNLTKIYPFEVYLPKKKCPLEKDSKAKADQIRTLDKSRLVKVIGLLSNDLIDDIDRAIKIHLSL